MDKNIIDKVDGVPNKFPSKKESDVIDGVFVEDEGNRSWPEDDTTVSDGNSFKEVLTITLIVVGIALVLFLIGVYTGFDFKKLPIYIRI